MVVVFSGRSPVLVAQPCVGVVVEEDWELR